MKKKWIAALAALAVIGAAVAGFLRWKRKAGGSKNKRDKGSMPGEPGNSRFTPPGNAGRGFQVCYGFGFLLRSVYWRAKRP